MKVLYVEGVAIHGGPEPCVGRPQGRRRSVGRGRAGRAMEPRNQGFGVPTLFRQAEGNIVGGAFASRWGTPRGRRTCACAKVSMRENREVRRSPVRLLVWAGRAGKAKAVIP
jgi:hypothetical protein